MPRKLDPNDERSQWTDKELLAAKFKPVDWVLPGYLPVGLVVLVGRPFSGKSFLSLQLTKAVSHGGLMFGERAKKGRVLYLALEDSNAGLRERMDAMTWQATGLVDFFTSWDRFSKGGMTNLAKRLKDGDYVLCVIDSLYKLLSGSKVQRDGEMEPVMTELHNFCKRGVVDVIMTLYHSNKMSLQTGEGGESAIIGDTAVAGVADSFWQLYKRPSNKQMFFHAEGRKLRKVDMAVQFEGKACNWEITLPKDKIKSDSVRGLILAKMREQQTPLSATQMAELLDRPVALVGQEMKVLADDPIAVIHRLPRNGVEVFYALAEPANGKKAPPLSFLP